MKAMLWVCVLVGLVVLTGGCLSAPKQSLPGQGAYINPGPDTVDAATQQVALKRGAFTIPEAASKVQDTGLSHYQESEEIFRLPDGQPFLLDLGNGRKVPLYEHSISITKWSSLHQLAGGKIKRLFLGIGTLFGAREGVQPSGEVAKAAQGRRNSFVLDVEELGGDLTKSADQLRAQWEGRAALQAMLNQGAEVNWAGAKGYIVAKADGLDHILATTAAGVKEIVGEVIKITPYGAANALGEKALKVLVKPVEADGKVKADSAATPVDVIPPVNQ